MQIWLPPGTARTHPPPPPPNSSKVRLTRSGSWLPAGGCRSLVSPGARPCCSTWHTTCTIRAYLFAEICTSWALSARGSGAFMTNGQPLILVSAQATTWKKWRKNVLWSCFNGTHDIEKQLNGLFNRQINISNIYVDILLLCSFARCTCTDIKIFTFLQHLVTLVETSLRGCLLHYLQNRTYFHLSLG